MILTSLTMERPELRIIEASVWSEVRTMPPSRLRLV
jgi:hypothetical protein